MRPTTDLVERRFIFSQLGLLTSDEFVRRLADRGVNISEPALEALHRRGVAVPLFRISRDGRSLVARLRTDPEALWRAATDWQPAYFYRYPVSAGLRVHDPADARFVSPESRVLRVAGGHSFSLSAYLYSPHQLIMLPLIRQALPYLQWSRRGVILRTRLTATDLLPRWQQTDRALREVVIAACVLEPRYYPAVVGRYTVDSRDGPDDFEAWMRDEPLTSEIDWLGTDAAWLFDRAGGLLRDADSFDPLGRWLEIVRLATPDTWDRLRGDARSAMDLRMVAEMLLRYHDELVPDGPQSIPADPDRRRLPVTSRLKRQQPLDQALTEFGLSPHPRLVIVFEGATEMTIWPRLLDYYGTRRDDDLFSIVDAEGVGNTIRALAAYIAPRGIHDAADGILVLTRPPTRLLLVCDPEGQMDTPAKREKRRSGLVDRIMDTLPEDARTEFARSQIDGFVLVETWNAASESFEFAHFKDRQIAQAFLRIPGRHTTKSVDDLAAIVKTLRVERGNLESVNRRISKVALANELWPVLERKITSAERRGTAEQIPIIRILDRAFRLAGEFPSRNLVIGTRAR
jgi:hypothetical protein